MRSKLASTCGLVVLWWAISSAAQAQQYGNYFINHGAASADSSGLTVWIAECKNLDLKSSKAQTLNCTLTPASTSNTCQPCYSSDPKQCTAGGICSFDVQSTDQVPATLIFGRSTTNPTCGWVYDPTRGVKVYRCW